MADIRNWWRNHRPTTRRLAQLYAALLYNANLKGFVEGQLYTGNAKAVCVPGLNCYSCPGAVGACPLGALQNALAASGHVAAWYVLGILLLYGVMLGRTICGWLCPFGLIQELLHKAPTLKLKKSVITRALTSLKYVILAVFVLAIPLIYGLRHGLPLPAFCKYICPAGTFEGAGALLANSQNAGMFAQLGVLFTRKSVILLAIALACVFCYRAFCRFLCPLGAIYSLFNRFALIGVKVDASRCNGCGACVRFCEMDVRRVSDSECISCGKCMAHCAQGAISFKCGKITLKGPECGQNADPEPVLKKRRNRSRVAWGALLLALAGALITFNFIDLPKTSAERATAPAETEAPPKDAEVAATASAGEDVGESLVGTEVGQRLADFEIELLDGTTFHLADTRGKIVFINEWATYCTPCVAELPYFERIQEEYPEVVVLAFHHWLEATPAPAVFVEEQGWSDWQVRFAVDADGSVLNAIGGDNVMPRTVVLNREGEIIYNQQRSMTYEMLVSLLEEAEG